MATGERTDLGSVGGWESGVDEGRLLEDRIVTLFSASVQQTVQVRTLDGSLTFESAEPVVDRGVHLAASGDIALLLEPKPIEQTLTIRRLNITTGQEDAPELVLDPVAGMEPPDAFCHTADWNGADLLCDQTTGPPLTIDPTTGVTKPIAGIDEGTVRYPRTGGDGSPAAERTQATPERCAGSNGTSPSTSEPNGGTYATHVRALDVPTSVTFDIIQWLSGQDAADAYQDDHPEETDGPPNDYYIVNDNEQVRTAPLEPDATVWLVRLAQTGSAALKPGTVSELARYRAEGSDEAVYWLTFDNGTITEVCEQYRP